MNDSQARIRAAIALGMQTPSLIADACSMKPQLVCYHLKIMVDEGLVVRRARGFYVLPKPIVEAKPEPVVAKGHWFSRFFA